MTKFYWQGQEIYSTEKRKPIALEEAQRYCTEHGINLARLRGDTKTIEIVEQRRMVANHLRSFKFSYICIGFALNKDHSTIKNYFTPKRRSVKYATYTDTIVKVDGEQVATLNYFGVLPEHYKRQFCRQFAGHYKINEKGVKISHELPRKDLPKWKPSMTK